MAIQGIMLRACSVVGHGFKPPFYTGFLAPLHQQYAGKSPYSKLEQKLGLPEKPKRPVGAFIEFGRLLRDKLKAENPSLLMKDISKMIGEEWKSADATLKQKFLDENHRLNKEYGEALQKYHLSLSDEQIAVLNEAKSKIKKDKIAKSVKKKLKELGKPKRPCNAYNLYLQDQINKGVFKDISRQELFKKAAEAWKEEPKEVVDKFVAKAEAARQQYKIELDTWEEKMTSAGHLDIYQETPAETPRKSKKKA